jgi:hypothetical protein
MQRLVILLTTATLATSATALSACGSLPDTDSLFASGTGGSRTTTSAHTTTTGTPATTSTTGTGTGGSASSSSGEPASTATSSSSTSASSSAGTTTSATSSSTVASSSSSSSASSSSGTATPIYCDGNPCSPGQVCCFNPTGPGDHCGNKGNCPNGYSELTCSSRSDCPGTEVCCAKYTVMGGNAVYQSVSCQPTCNQPGSEFMICTGEPQACPPPTMCIQSQLLGQGYDICAQ